ncbi:CCR4-NOT transcription complex subunit 1-like [Maniola jurtina]|uniref:CCR4-NOT transcription complex subunit 1-like n=1 Tax=Maniola jurtina TaxID=191418 RepID=UPI001E6881DB|nr:CCR4-NOT transcription complex subunit 1-like [Maniola jurtina]
MTAQQSCNDMYNGIQEKTANLLWEWGKILQSSRNEMEIDQKFNIFVHTNRNGIFKSVEMISEFFRIATQMCVKNVYQLLNKDKAPPRRENYYVMCDSFIKLVSLLIKKNAHSANPAPQLKLLPMILNTIAGRLLQDQEEHGIHFHQLPYHRLIIILFLEMTQEDMAIVNYEVVFEFYQMLRIVRPSAAPGFCYAWLEIVAHRVFMHRVLVATSIRQGAGMMYCTLLILLFEFLHPFLRNTEWAPPVIMLYKGTLKVLLVLVHDFPEFLCDYHYRFCDEIPPNCIQMRNIILSAYPMNMIPPYPLSLNLDVDLIAEMSLPPRTAIHFEAIIPSSKLKKDLDAYLEAQAPVTFLSELRSNIQVVNELGSRYDTKMMNAVVLYVGTKAIAHIRAKGQTPNMTTIAHSAHMDIFQNFAVDFDCEGRALFLNAIANQLRYPNSHTHYFSCCLLYLFAEAVNIKEQITRVLFERFLAERPIPWGILVTLNKLVHDPVYKFWTQEFVVRCKQDIGNVARIIATRHRIYNGQQI